MAELLIFALLGSGFFALGCLYFFFKNKRPHMYYEIKELIHHGNQLAKFLIWLLYLSIFSAAVFTIASIVSIIKR